MTAAAMETNVDGIQEPEIAILSVDKGGQQTKKVRRRMNNAEVTILPT